MGACWKRLEEMLKPARYRARSNQPPADISGASARAATGLVAARDALDAAAEAERKAAAAETDKDAKAERQSTAAELKLLKEEAVDVLTQVRVARERAGN